jgi:hypothetical protein
MKSFKQFQSRAHKLIKYKGTPKHKIYNPLTGEATTVKAGEAASRSKSGSGDGGDGNGD